MTKSTIHYDAFFYPLDSIRSWNRIYGPNGFLQLHCVIPMDKAKESLLLILKTIRDRGEASYLSTLKTFGDSPSRGLLSFPKEGLTLTLDFPNFGDTTSELLRDLYHIVEANHGRIYPAKDQMLTRVQFERMYPNYPDFIKFVDPHFSSDWWKRARN